MVFFGLGIGEVFSIRRKRGWKSGLYLLFAILHLTSFFFLGKTIEVTSKIILSIALTLTGILLSSFIIIRKKLTRLIKAGLKEIDSVEREFSRTLVALDIVSIVASFLVVMVLYGRKLEVFLSLNILLLVSSLSRMSLLVLIGSKWLPVLPTALAIEVLFGAMSHSFWSILSYMTTSTLILTLSIWRTSSFSREPAYLIFRSMVEENF